MSEPFANASQLASSLSPPNMPSYTSNKPSMYDALSHSPDSISGHKPRPDIYRKFGQAVHGVFEATMPMSGMVKQSDGTYLETNKFNIAYTLMGNKGPVVAFLHGVPTNRRQWFPIQELCAPFCRTISFDMLGMGESDKVRNYGVNQSSNNAPWDWVNDIPWVDQIMTSLFPGNKFVFVADDWGGGINVTYASHFDSERLLALIDLDPIAFDGYPVNEIQAIGRASGLSDEQFMMAMGASDQTLVQIFKTMVYDPNKYNQYNLRDIMFPYVDVDYERSAYKDGEDATSTTMRLKWEALRVLADRAAILAPSLLLPYDSVKNPKGVKYDKITVPTLILWGEYDNMMPSNQIYLFANALENSDVQIELVPRAGHFAGTDQPELVAEKIINFVGRVVKRKNLADVFLGYTGIWKGDEHMKIKDLRKIYGMNH